MKIMKVIIAEKKFRELLIPTILIAMALNITAIVDASFVATYVSADAQAALQVLEPLVLLVTVFEWFFGLGGQILALNRKAEFDTEGSNHYFTLSIIATIAISLILAIFCLMFPDYVMAILHCRADLAPLAKSYGFYFFISMPISVTLAVLSQYIRVDGQPNLSSALIVVANLINIILNFVFLDLMHMGIEGSSLGLLIGYSVGLICSILYFISPKRTFRFSFGNVPIKKWFKSFAEMLKIGFPGASIGIFDLLLIEIMNVVLEAVMGKPGLNAYNVCTNALLIISILVVGISETLSSIVPVYYTHNDYLNLNHLIRRSLLATTICAIAFIALIWISPDTILMFFSLTNNAAADQIRNALKIFSISFLPYVLSTMLIFYYEAIERTVVSTIISFISTFLGPLVLTFALYPIIGVDGIWLSFPLGTVLAITVAWIYVKIVERKEKEYSGPFFIKKDLIQKTRNYTIESVNDATRTEMMEHLKTLDLDDSSTKTIVKLIDEIFKFNNNDVAMEVLIVDYDDNITINIKDEGKKNIWENISKDLLDNKSIKFTEVLGFNNTEYVINKS